MPSDVGAAIKMYLNKGMPGYVHKEKLILWLLLKLLKAQAAYQCWPTRGLLM